MANAVAIGSSLPQPIAGKSLRLDPPPHPLPQSVSTLRSGHLTLDTLSPVNQNGSFEFDREIKAGDVLKRTRKTKAWKPIYIVLRPNLLSMYRDSGETKLRHQITLSDLTTVARQKDPKGRAKHVFALFSPSRNYHLEARNDQDAQEWVELIRREARIDEEEEDMTLASPGGARAMYSGFGRHSEKGRQHTTAEQSTGYSSSEAELFQRSSPMRKNNPSSAAAFRPRRVSHTMDYSGPEQASHSDYSDSAGPTAKMSALSLSRAEQYEANATGSRQRPNSVYGPSPSGAMSASQMSGLDLQEHKASQHHDEERVICHGWIYLLKTKSGMRQWKKLWMVLRHKSLALYKNEEEYSAVLVLPFAIIINAVDIDPISNSKPYCLQIITEEKNYRLCAPDEDNLAKWLGAFKSVLIKRRELQVQRSNYVDKGI